MNYRISTRIVGILDLITSTVCLIVVVGGFGFLLVGGTILQIARLFGGSSSTNALICLYVVFPFVIFFIALYCGYANFMADWDLILSTRKEQDPQSAIKFSSLWVSISYLTICFRGLIILLFFYSDIIDCDRRQQRYHVSYSSFLVFILFFIRVFQMYCVIKYRLQLKGWRTVRSSDNIIIRGSRRTEEVVVNFPINSARPIIIPIPSTIVANTNENAFGRSEMSTSTGDLPSYESAIFTNFKFLYPPPPSYDSLYNTKDMKITVDL